MLERKPPLLTGFTARSSGTAPLANRSARSAKWAVTLWRRSCQSGRVLTTRIQTKGSPAGRVIFLWKTLHLSSSLAGVVIVSQLQLRQPYKIISREERSTNRTASDSKTVEKPQRARLRQGGCHLRMRSDHMFCLMNEMFK